jgi:type IX secretion system PorP/SprF family membrane protein
MFFDDWYPDLNSGVGISFISHQETFTKYSLKQLNISWTYNVQINYEWNFRPSVTFGFATKDFGFDNIVFEDQIDIYQNIISLNTYDPIALDENSRYVDFGASFLVYTDQHWFGLTLRHLNKPNISMLSQGDLPLDLFISAHASLELPFLKYNNDNSVNFIMNFVKQAKYDRFDFGFQYMYDRFSFALTAATNPIQTSDESHLITSINPIVGFVWEGFKFGYSYDFNISNIGGDGGISEISITYDFLYNKDCFGCPIY